MTKLFYTENINVQAVDFEKVSLGFKRFEIYGDSQNSILSRVVPSFPINAYMFDGLLVPFIGAGFYVAPVNDEFDSLRYRVGYGIHNSYLFAFEQGGSLVFVLFILFLIFSIRYLNRGRKSRSLVDRQFALALSAYMAFLLVNAFAGQAFWRGFETGNYNTYVVLLLVIATRGYGYVKLRSRFND